MPQELEILEIMADFAIFLISITIPTYAVAVSLLGAEYTKMVKRVTEEKENLEKELQKPVESGLRKLEEIEKKIKEFHEREQKLKSRYNPLSLYPTIIFPNIFFGIALITVLVGIYFNAQSFVIWLGVSSFFILCGITILGWALEMIQKAARGSSE